jgi:hypothetical protein
MSPTLLDWTVAAVALSLANAWGRRVEVTGPRGADGGLRANRFGSVVGRAADGACLVSLPDQPAAVVGLEYLALAGQHRHCVCGKEFVEVSDFCYHCGVARPMDAAGGVGSPAAPSTANVPWEAKATKKEQKASASAKSTHTGPTNSPRDAASVMDGESKSKRCRGMAGEKSGMVYTKKLMVDAEVVQDELIESTLAQHGLANTKSGAPKAKTKTMEPWEKEKLVRDMDRLDPEKLGTALGIIRKSNKVDLDDVDSDGGVTIDIDTLDVRAL